MVSFSRVARPGSGMRAGWVALMLLVAAGASAQQVPEPSAAPDTGSAPARSRQSLSLLDAPVSRADYLLGPGDLVSVSLVGDVNRVHMVEVTPEGTLVIPSLGVVRVLGQDLDQAQAGVRGLVGRYYRSVDATLSLAQVRSFKVFVVGDVEAPGVRVATAATRVSEVVPAGVGRNVLVRRASGDSVLADLARFRHTGAVSANPLLREGDVLVVPSVDETVSVYGRLPFPGAYQYRGGETLGELLWVAAGGRALPADVADTIRLTRFVGPQQRQMFAFTREEAMGPRGRAFVLEPFDAVYVAEVANFREQKTVTVRGQVANPGTYPIEPGVTTVRELVRLAGGFTPDASLVDATLQRQAFNGLRKPGELEEGTREDELETIPPELLTEEERQVRRIRSQSRDPQVVVDFRALYADGEDAYDQPLESGDVLTVPRRREEILILGAVMRPGLVRVTPGQGFPDLVRMAGGYSRRADQSETMVIRAGSGARVYASEVDAIHPGDTVVVPYREPGEWLAKLQTANAVITGIAGVVLTFLAVF